MVQLASDNLQEEALKIFRDGVHSKNSLRYLAPSLSMVFSEIFMLTIFKACVELRMASMLRPTSVRWREALLLLKSIVSRLAILAIIFSANH
jgi:hypothetical protein